MCPPNRVSRSTKGALAPPHPWWIPRHGAVVVSPSAIAAVRFGPYSLSLPSVEGQVRLEGFGLYVHPFRVRRVAEEHGEHGVVVSHHPPKAPLGRHRAVRRDAAPDGTVAAHWLSDERPFICGKRSVAIEWFLNQETSLLRMDALIARQHVPTVSKRIRIHLDEREPLPSVARVAQMVHVENGSLVARLEWIVVPWHRGSWSSTSTSTSTFTVDDSSKSASLHRSWVRPRS